MLRPANEPGAPASGFWIDKFWLREHQKMLRNV